MWNILALGERGEEEEEEEEEGRDRAQEDGTKVVGALLGEPPGPEDGEALGGYAGCRWHAGCRRPRVNDRMNGLL